MDIIFDSLAVGMMSTNCYVLGDAQTKEAVIIDPGADSISIKRLLTKHRLHPKCIINTHGHADHIGANPDFHLPVWIHTDDADFLTNPAKNL
jgi:glyoxylase-like metal-dependent hydrolase (beta-lactamase superfamily II)